MSDNILIALAAPLLFQSPNFIDDELIIYPIASEVIEGAQGSNIPQEGKSDETVPQRISSVAQKIQTSNSR